MDIGQVEAFVQVANHRSFSKAAEALFLTQPSVTARIQSLEKELDEEMFERTGRGVRLTEAGSVFLPYAEMLLRTLRDGRDALDSLRNAEFGNLRLGTAFTISAYVLPGILRNFCARYPGVEVSVRTGRSEQVLQMVLADDVQVGLVRALQHPEIESIPLHEEEIVLVVNPSHEFAEKWIVGIDELARQPLIFFDKGSSYYALTQSLFRQAGVVPRIAMELDSMEATKKMVEEGLGIALLPRASVQREIELGILKEAQVRGAERVRRPISLIYRRNRKRPRVVQAFMEVLAEMYGFRVPEAAKLSPRRRESSNGRPPAVPSRTA
ncbi:MAG TPA: LysR family transcriptional regulator [Dehalococcoidia bacterium]|nr:LysR family transcriptional regulator [Dehalococcoidia bacterium]